MNDKRTKEGIDACRPGSNDLAAGELSFLPAELAKDARLRATYDRVQKLDAKIAAAFQDVSVPEGLRDRLLARLAEAAGQPTPNTAAPNTAAPDAPTITLPPREEAARPRSTRRWWLSAAAALAASILVVVVGWPWWFPAHSYSRDDVLAAAEDLWSAQSANPEQWTTGTPLPAYPLSTSVRVPTARQQAVEDFLGQRGMAYDLAGAGQPSATLFVVKLSVHDMPVAPPERPQSTSNGRSAAAWQENGLVYVLVVEGDASRYRSLLKLPRGVLT